MEDTLNKAIVILQNYKTKYQEEKNLETCEILKNGYNNVIRMLYDKKLIDGITTKRLIESINNENSIKDIISNKVQEKENPSQTNENKKKDTTEFIVVNSQNQKEMFDYVGAIMSNNQLIGSRITDYFTTLKDSLKNPNPISIKTWFDNFKNFCEVNNLDKNHMIVFAQNIMNEFDQNKKYGINNNFELVIKETQKKENDPEKKEQDEKEPEKKEPEKKEPEKKEPQIPIDKYANRKLSVKSVKKANHSAKEFVTLAGYGLMALNAAFLPATQVVVAAYLVMRVNAKIKNHNLYNKILKKYKLHIHGDDLVDRHGRIVDENYKDKELYESVKRELLAFEDRKKSNNIKNTMLKRKEKLKAKLLNIKMVKKIIEYQEDREEFRREEEEIKKGMGGM